MLHKRYCQGSSGPRTCEAQQQTSQSVLCFKGHSGAKMIETSELTNRILQLKDSQGLSFIEITNLLTNEGVVGRDKRPLNVNAVKARYSRFKRAKKRSQDGDGAPSESSHTEHHTKNHTTSRN